MAACFHVPFDPVSPSWDIQVSAGLARSSHSIRDLVGDLASLPPEVLDTLDLTDLSIRFEETLVIGDTTGDGIADTGLTPEFFQSVSHAELFVEAENGTPVRMAISMEIRDHGQAVLLRIPEEERELDLQAAPLDETGKVGSPTSVRTVVELSDGLTTVFENGEQLAYTVDLSFPESVTVAHVLASDSMSIRLWGTFVSKVDP
ncbi:MAG: hypothetical protein OEV30_06405 [Ignavibacteria bacterium]|nr:hypothetical protein [Ignavibacteria bacterium]